MEFIKQMKKREFIEMTLKTIAAVLAAFLAIILMESMIYGINVNTLKTVEKNTTTHSSSTIAYCLKESDDKYFVIYYDETSQAQGEALWFANANKYYTKAECDALKVKEVKYQAPSPFDFTITATHYVVMSVFVVAIGGFFAWKFVKLAKTYKDIEEEFNKTGTISITNV
ncbi:MAG: hypothetical protein IKM43_00840 [Clostridia bacterium]|nr:hypothetical protein [Clostridia bacterium]